MSDKNIEKNGVSLERLRKLIDTKTREEIAKRLECDTSLVTKHYNGKREVTAEYVVKYAKYFGVSADYLLGIAEHKTPIDTIEGEIIRSVCDYTGLNEQAVETLHSVSLPIAIDCDAELLDKEELECLDDERKKAEKQKTEMFELINYFLVSAKFYESVKSLQKYLFNVDSSTKNIENSLNELLNKKITAKKFYEDDLCWIEIDITRKEKEDYNRLFYYEAVEALKNVVDNRCSRYIEDFEKAKLKMHYIYKSLFPINVSWSGITFGDIILGNYKELNETETKELDTIIEFLKQYFLDIRAGKEGETNAHNNETE